MRGAVILKAIQAMGCVSRLYISAQTIIPTTLVHISVNRMLLLNSSKYLTFVICALIGFELNLLLIAALVMLQCCVEMAQQEAGNEHQ